MSIITSNQDSDTYQIIFSSRGSNVTNRGAGGVPANICALDYYLNLMLFYPWINTLSTHALLHLGLKYL